MNQTDELCDLIANTPVTVEEWNRQKQIYNTPHEHPTLKLAFATFFLNRTSVSGILNGGIIGGIDQTGNYPIDARYNTMDLIERIRRISKYRTRIHLYNMDAAKFIPKIIRPMSRNTLVYLDPPYYIKGAKLYDNYYENAHHTEIRELIAQHLRIKKWVVSYDNVPQIRKLYTKYRSLIYGLKYSANQKIEGQEVMYFNHNVIIPQVDSPAYISKSKYSQLVSEYRQLPLPL